MEQRSFRPQYPGGAQTSYGVFMATMIPATLPEDATEGERRLYRFLENLPVFFTAWINPSLDGETADFVL